MPMNDNILSVKQLNFYVKSLIEGDRNLSFLCVAGEISNFKNHYSSGHYYFTLKDEDAAIHCVMFRAYASRINFEVKDGLQVLLKGKVSLYEKDGQYQFYAEEMTDLGLGNITLEFNRLKAKLENEGLFDSDTKRPIPKFPIKIAVVTSKTGAAVKDIINVVSRRWPLAEILMCPVAVQGDLAVPQMLEALENIYTHSNAELIIIGRGGGSIEDLWAFNSEELARKIYESPIPVISAVGHETDFTICDFVADLRAPTPSAAAELAVPDIIQLEKLLNKYSSILLNSLKSKYSLAKARLEKSENLIYFKNPKEAFLYLNSERLDRLFDRLNSLVNGVYDDKTNRLNQLILNLETLSPLKTLTRGYASVSKNNEPVKSVDSLQTGDIIDLKLFDGELKCQVNQIEKH